jgi:hypothetical protein
MPSDVSRLRSPAGSRSLRATRPITSRKPRRPRTRDTRIAVAAKSSTTPRSATGEVGRKRVWPPWTARTTSPRSPTLGRVARTPLVEKRTGKTGVRARFEDLDDDLAGGTEAHGLLGAPTPGSRASLPRRPSIHTNSPRISLRTLAASKRRRRARRTLRSSLKPESAAATPRPRHCNTRRDIVRRLERWHANHALGGVAYGSAFGRDERLRRPLLGPEVACVQVTGQDAAASKPDGTSANAIQARRCRTPIPEYGFGHARRVK